jgi:electron transfer flavoprotein alpha/beta subunit
MMMAQSKPINTFSLSDLGWEEVSAPLPRHKVLEIRSPQESAAAEIIPGSPPEAAAVLMKKIREVL